MAGIYWLSTALCAGPKGITMGCGRYIGYVGGLAVAMGVAVATTPGIAYALPADAGSDSPTTGESSTTAPPSTPSSTIDGTATPPNRLSDSELRDALSDLPSRLAGTVSKIFGGRDGAPVVVLRSSGGAHAAKDDRDAKGSAANALTTVSKLPGADTVDRDTSRGHLLRDGERIRQQVQSLGGGVIDQSGVPAGMQSARSVEQQAPTLDFTPAAINSLSLNPVVAPPTAVVSAHLQTSRTSSRNRTPTSSVWSRT